MITLSAISADNLRRLLLLRTVSVLAALVMAVLSRPLFHILPDNEILFAIIAIWAAFTAATWLRGQKSVAQRHEPLLHLAIDLLLLTLFLTFSGGTANPLAALYLMPVAAAAAVLPQALAWTVAAVAVGAYALLWKVAVPVTVEDVDAAMQMHLTGMWLTFGLSAALLVGIVARMSAALREREQHLAAARAHSLRDERIVALGSLAAGAAHQLGTPLNTMTLLADEIHATAGPGSAMAADAAELQTQVGRCRDIVANLLADAGITPATETVTISTWLTRIVTRFRHLRGDCTPTIEIDAELGEQRIHPEATLNQTLQDLLDNAADVSPSSVIVRLTRHADNHLAIAVHDAGKGFSAAALAQVGRAPWSDKPHGMGLGLYLAQATAERLGGTLSCRNGAAGAVIELRIPLTVLT